MPPQYHIGQRVSFKSVLCTIRYIGLVEGTENVWLGVEWDNPERGKHDGSINDVKYFECLSKSKTAASFVRPARQADFPRSFVEAVYLKYATEDLSQITYEPLEKQHIISGKVVEEVGFDKIRQQQAQLSELKIVIVDGLRINLATAPGSQTIVEVCPKIKELDLSRNLFESFEDVVEICGELHELTSLRINENRMDPRVKDLSLCEKSLRGILNLEMDNVLMPWESICSVTKNFLTLKAFTASLNGFELITEPLLTRSLTKLTLEDNLFTSLSALAPLSKVPSIQSLLLKGNQISQASNQQSGNFPVFGDGLSYVDLSYNSIATWGFIDELAAVFPGLTALRVSHNPVYENLIDSLGSNKGIEEGYMLTLARIGRLKALNFSNITTADRSNAEMYYLSRIGKEMAEVSESDEGTVISQHRRYDELCKIYGEPVVVRKSDANINPNFLEARLIKFTFYMSGDGNPDTESSKDIEIPKGFDIYRVKSIVGKAFGVRPSGLRLIWETGEWDPVAGYEDEENNEDDTVNLSKADSSTATSEHMTGRWMRREVEIEDGTRQVGNYVDGREAKVRVEPR